MIGENSICFPPAAFVSDQAASLSSKILALPRLKLLAPSTPVHFERRPTVPLPVTGLVAAGILLFLYQFLRLSLIAYGAKAKCQD
jgi:hypothetical protein